ncbi:MAG: nucleotide exchange factor GrpE [Chloroflexi bacterium]|nr:nucleotide exchange factor GrpE [Chloroflexota bacterium]
MEREHRERKPKAETEEVVDADSESPKRLLEEQTAKAEGYLNSWKRSQADFENYKKRAEQERQETSAYANATLVSSLLPVLDDLERALDTLDASVAGLTWIEGIKLVYRKLAATLESQGLRVIQSTGVTFDPKFHEAMMQVPGPEGKVVGELQKGYTLRDRVLRPAMVKVGNGEPAE